MNNDRPGIVPREALSSMTTSVLEALLDREMDKTSEADIDIELIKEITAILDARTGNSNIDVDAAYDDFISTHLGNEMFYPAVDEDIDEIEDSDKPSAPVTPIRHRRLARLGLVAAVLVVLLVGATVTANAAGFNLWKAFAQWTSETFEFDMYADSPSESMEGDERFAEFRRVLSADGVPLSFLPRFLSEGYNFVRIESGNGEYRAIFENGNQSITIQIHPMQTGNATLMEKNVPDPDKYIVNGIEHHIVSNLGLYSITWVNSGYECTIMGIPSEDDAYKMIDSIYWEDSK